MHSGTVLIVGHARFGSFQSPTHNHCSCVGKILENGGIEGGSVKKYA